MTKVLVLGANGMLGRAVATHLRANDVEVIATTRTGQDDSVAFVANQTNFEMLVQELCLAPGDYVVNAIGMISHRLNESSVGDRLIAIDINSRLPHELAETAEKLDLNVIQIATDCVFAGSEGSYSEDSIHDARDIYGRTKSLGEVPSPKMMHLRCSIVGPESGRNLSLFEWVRGQELGASVNGFTDHFWNGVTTHAFAKITLGIIKSGNFRPGVFHLVPRDCVSKAQLVRLLAEVAGRSDLKVSDFATGRRLDRTLSTNNPKLNEEFWLLAGYSDIPTIQQLIEEIGLQ